MSTLLINSGDTSWMLISTALVMLLTIPGISLFYGGMSKKENVLNTMFLSLISFSIASIIWVAYGYQLAFGTSFHGLIGSPTSLFIDNITLNILHPDTGIPELLYIVFQATFAGITIALISGAIVGRMRVKSWILFTILWITLVYIPIAHWIWGGGWLNQLGVIDFAGGTVVELNSGISSLAIIAVLGARKDKRLLPHHLGYSVAGVGLLWFGWFGFNAGSAIAANGLAASAFIVTNTAAASGMIAWVLIDLLKNGKATVLGAISGAVAGLVAITPAAGFVKISGSIVIGFTATMISYFAISYVKPKLGYDDALDVFGIHGMSGLWGTLLTGVFACPVINTATGLIYGNSKQLEFQIISIVAVGVYAFIVTYVISQVIDKTIGIRVDSKAEIEGLDSNEHEEIGYRI